MSTTVKNTLDAISAAYGTAGFAGLARDLGMPKTTVHTWYRRGRVPKKHVARVFKVAKNHKLKISLADLTQ